MRLLILALALFLNASALTFDEYKTQQDNSFDQYKTNLNTEFENYKKAYDEALKEFKKEISDNWNDKQIQITTKNKFVEYSPDLKSRKIVDFKNQNMSFEVIANDEKEARTKINNMFNKLIQENVKDAYKNDLLENKVQKKLKQTTQTPKSTEPIIADMLNDNDVKKLKQNLETQKFIKVKEKDKFIYKANLQFPPNALIKKAKMYKQEVMANSKKQNIPPQLIYAIIHSESSFNPMARSNVPAFGLMQIVPRTAGVDAYEHIYGTKKLLSSYYLYNESNNIKLGSAYLNLLYFSYLKQIDNPTSRLLCTICAYNTGAGNVAKAFTNTTNKNKAAQIINTMSPEAVYKKLIRSLPYMETRIYLKKVYDRTFVYDKLIGSEI